MDREDLLLKALFGMQNELYAIRCQLEAITTCFENLVNTIAEQKGE